MSVRISKTKKYVNSTRCMRKTGLQYIVSIEDTLEYITTYNHSAATVLNKIQVNPSDWLPSYDDDYFSDNEDDSDTND